MWKSEYFCRWCGTVYTPTKYTCRDGFCSTKHKQALYRAYKAYVTVIGIANKSTHDHQTRVTQKKQAATKGIARATRDIGLLLSQNKRKKAQGATRKCQT